MNEPEPELFYERLCKSFAEISKHACNTTPELANVVVVFNYKGALNDTPNMRFGVFVGKDGLVTKPAEIVSATSQVFKMLAYLQANLLTMHEDVKKELTESLLKLLEVRKELNGEETSKKKEGEPT